MGLSSRIFIGIHERVEALQLALGHAFRLTDVGFRPN